jgi:molybdate/tungstate transport system substrate-binding protein
MRRRHLLAVLSSLALLSACREQGVTPVSVLYAGSLIIPFQALETAYEASHPEIDLQMEGHGSIQVIRHVTEIHELVDVVATADSTLVPMLMYPNLVPETGRPYADWLIEFAGNRLALAYRPESRYAGEIDADNWYRILARPDVRVGLADPRFDASGYRALMALQMAEAFYGHPTILEDVTLAQFVTPLSVEEGEGLTTIRIPRIVDTRDGAHLVLRGASIALIALLESGDLDYAFEYESVIAQHGFEVLSLPEAINLGSDDYAEAYSRVEVSLDFQRFASVTPVFRGEPIRYAVTIPSNAPHPAEAADFLAFLLGPEGQAILRDHHHPMIIPARTDHLSALPEVLQPLCVEQP